VPREAEPKSQRKTLGFDAPVVPVHVQSLLVGLLAEQGVPVSAVLQGSGLTPAQLQNPDCLISLQQTRTLVENALRLSANPALGLDFGRRLHMSQLGVLGFALLTAENLAAALDTLVRFQGLLGPAWSNTWSVDRDRAVVVTRRTIALGATDVFTAETWCVALARGIAELTGAPLADAELLLDYPPPPHAARYAQVLGLPVRFAASVRCLRFARALLDAPLPGASTVSHRQALSLCEAELSRRDLREDLPSRVKRALRAAATPPTLPQLASALCMSERTLERRLHDYQTGFRQLADEVRRDAAVALVGGSTQPIELIAQQLGYQDLSNFSKAFRRWTGDTPGRYRRAPQPGPVKRSPA